MLTSLSPLVRLIGVGVPSCLRNASQRMHQNTTFGPPPKRTKILSGSGNTSICRQASAGRSSASAAWECLRDTCTLQRVRGSLRHPKTAHLTMPDHLGTPRGIFPIETGSLTHPKTQLIEGKSAICVPKNGSLRRPKISQLGTPIWEFVLSLHFSPS